MIRQKIIFPIVFILSSVMGCLEDAPTQMADNPNDSCEYEIPSCTFQASEIKRFEINSPKPSETIELDYANPTFSVEGESEGLVGLDSCHKIVLFVYPDNPQGNGWYPQCGLGQVDPTGHWFAVGNLGDIANFRPKSGDAFSIKAYITNDPNKLLNYKVLPAGGSNELGVDFKSSNTILLVRVK